MKLSEAKRKLLAGMMSGAGLEINRKAGSVVPRAAGIIAPISSEQGQLWLHAEMAGSVPIYNKSITVHRRGSFNLGVMERSFNEILRRHEIWRTSFEIVDGEIVQIVQPDLRIALTLDDLTSLPSSERAREALQMATKDARQPIDLRTAPLFRARVVKLAENEHCLYVAIHHIIFDGVSLSRIFVRELSAVYDAYSREACSPLAEPALQYGDYAIWRQQQLESGKVERQMEYWRRTLSGPLPRLAFAGDHPHGTAATYRGAMKIFTLPSEIAAALKALSRAEGATLYMTLLTAFKAMLFRYTGQDDILLGGVTDLRRRPELEQLMGYFLTSMPLRTRPSADMTFRNYLAQTKMTVLGALGASEVPFDRLVREFSIGRDPDAHPLFQVMFSMQPLVEAYPAGWDLTQMDVEVGGAKFDLYLELEERPHGVIGRFIYACDLFEADTIDRMIGHYQTLLEGVLADPGSTLARLPLMTGVESWEILQAWNATATTVPANTVHQWFQEQAQRTPDRVAVIFEDRSWTYRELDRRSDAVAWQLQQAGVGNETLVAICMNRSPEMITGLLGILKAGGAYLPLDPAFPQPRLAFIIENAKPAVLLTETKLSSTLADALLPLILCDVEVGEELPPFRADVDGGNLAYVLYTSGSTGQPKGVEVPHSSVVNMLAAMQREPGFTGDDTLLALATVGFDLAVYELFLPLVSGGRLVIASREVAADPTLLAGLIDRSGCTFVAATPATWRALIATGWSGSHRLTIFCCGETLPRGLAEALLQRCEALWNGYGPTETTVFSTVHKVVSGSGPVPIGRPIANTQHYILDSSGNAVPVGVMGELYIGGAGVSRGYRHRPDLTRDRFVECAVAPGARLYRTGDLARYRADGAIDYFGRTDSEEKIRGFRVAVEEIEAALVRHPAVASAAVKAWPDASGNKALTAYLVLRDGHEPEVAGLRSFLGESLPDFMIPAHFERIRAMPMTPTGKIDRKTLPQTTGDRFRAAFAPPEGAAEEDLADIWKDVLSLPAVGRNENFFDLGGHSLLAAKLLRRIEDKYARRLTMATFFHAPTIEALASLIGDDAGFDRHLTIPIQPNGSRPPLLWLDGTPAFRALAHAIGFDQPFVGIPLDQILELNATSSMPLEKVAELVTKTVREVQPQGPYYLGGWCNMGTLAFEVASQLSRSGQTVGLVILLDATNPVTYRRITPMAFLLSQLRYHWPRFRCLRIGEKRLYLVARAQSLLRKLVQLPAADRSVELSAKFTPVVRAYSPSVYSGDVALFQPMLKLDVLDFRPGWAEVVTGELSAFSNPGNHVTMLEEPDVRQLAVSMRAALLRAQEREAPSLPLLRA